MPNSATIITGPLSPDDYYTGLTGPTNFGIGFGAVADSSTGDIVGVGFGYLGTTYYDLLSVPLGYVSNHPLSDTSTYNGETFSSLGATPGTYVWTWGTGANQNFTLVVGEVPEPSTWAMMSLASRGSALWAIANARNSSAQRASEGVQNQSRRWPGIPRTAACSLAFRRRSRLPAANAAPAITPAPGAARPAPAVAPAAPPSDVDKVAARIADHAFRERNNLHRRAACGSHRGKNEPCQHDRDRSFRHWSVLPLVARGRYQRARAASYGLLTGAPLPRNSRRP